MSKKWVVALVIVVLLGGLVLAAPFFLDVNRYRGAIQTRLSKAIGREVTLADLRLSFFPMALESKDVRIADDPAFRKGDFVSVQSFRIHVNFWPLLRRQVQVTSLELMAPQVWLVKNSQGLWNFSTLAQSSEPAAATPPPDAGASPGAINSFDIYELRLTNGKVTVADGANAQSYELLDFTARNISATSAIPFSLSLRMPDEKEEVHLDGKAGPLDPKELANSPAAGSLSVKRYHVGNITLENLKGDFTIRQGVLRVKPIDFDLYSGHETGSVVLNFLDPKPSLELATRLSAIDVNQFLSSTGSAGKLLYGLLSGEISLRTSGQNQQQVLRNLKGTAALDLQKGKLAHIAVGRQIATIAQLAGVTLPDKETPITKMGGHIEIADNFARTNDLQVETPDINLQCQGSFNFDGDMNFNVLGTFSREVSQQIQSRSPVGGLLNAVLQDENKQVVIPLQVLGNFEAPRFKLDAQKLLSMRMRSGQTGVPSNIQDKLRSLRDLFKKKK